LRRHSGARRRREPGTSRDSPMCNYTSEVRAKTRRRNDKLSVVQSGARCPTSRPLFPASPSAACEEAQHGVDAALIALAFLLEEVEHVLINRGSRSPFFGRHDGTASDQSISLNSAQSGSLAIEASTSSSVIAFETRPISLPLRRSPHRRVTIRSFFICLGWRAEMIVLIDRSIRSFQRATETK